MPLGSLEVQSRCGGHCAADQTKDAEEYRAWLKKEHGVEITTRTQTYYGSALNAAVEQIRSSHFWASLGQRLREFEDAYWLRTDYKLFAVPEAPLLQVKPF